jgi:hypothetical protein
VTLFAAATSIAVLVFVIDTELSVTAEPETVTDTFSIVGVIAATEIT